MSRLLLAATLALAAALALATPPPALAAKSVCEGKQRGAATHSEPVRDAQGRQVATVWFHQLRSDAAAGCAVLRAVAWKGTPHYMFIRSCDRQTGPRSVTGCTGHDAGQYREYAGPIYFGRWFCHVAHVKLQPPGGGRMIERFVNGPCN